MDEALQDLGDYVSAALPTEATNFEIAKHELVVWTKRESIVKVLTFLRDDQNCQIKMLVDITAVDYPDRAERFEVDQSPRREDWPTLLDRAREACRNDAFPGAQRWHEAVKTLQKRGASLIEEWENRPTTGWIHGDLHPANVMSRSDDDPNDPAMLLDLAEVRAGHWIEDAVYLERIYWARRSIINDHPPVKLIAKARKRYGIPGAGDAEREGEIGRLAEIRRVLLAATAPAYLKSEGNPVYLAACLDVLENALATLR